MHAATIVARNYLPYARVLAESFAKHHPEDTFSVLVIDDLHHEVEATSEPFQVLRLEDIGLDALEQRRMTLIYDVMELATAVKPWLLRSLLEGGADAALYLDPDIEVYAPLDELAALAIEHGIVLTPHGLQPMQRDGRRPTEEDILQSGVYNLGFLGVGQAAHEFLDWWSERLLRDAISDPARMLFTDQRWVDFVPSYFPHVIVRDPGYNVAYWNVDRRTVTHEGDQYAVDGAPLRFFHFSGYSPDRPWLLSKHMGDQPRVLLSERPEVASLCADYGCRLVRAGWGEDSPAYAFARLPSGLPLDRRMRRLYRSAVIAAEKGQDHAPPLPHDAATSQRFVEWLNEPVAPVGAPKVSRYLEALYLERADLRSAFPDLGGPAGDAYLDWAVRHGSTEVPIPPELLQPARPASSRPRGTALADGINITGYLRAELGVGEAARMLVAAVQAADIPHATVDYRRTLSRQQHAFAADGLQEGHYNVNAVCVNADMFVAFAGEAGVEFFADRYTIGMWAWEVDRIPPAMLSAFDYVDEVWVGSAYTRAALEPVATKPVYVFPLPISAPAVDPDVTRHDLGLPPGFVFLFAFDYLSVAQRKNPEALVEAFSRAFAPGEGPTLVIKTINGDKRLAELERLRHLAAERPDILVIDGYLPAAHKNALMALSDCYVSLHRAEGFGLTMAEAMALGKPVVATGYSGNLEFMDHHNSYLVPFSLTPVGPGYDPYPPDSHWAEPDVEAAADIMRGVVSDPEGAAQIGARARADIATRHSPAARRDFLHDRFRHAVRAASQSSVADFLSRGDVTSGSVPQRARRAAERARRVLAERRRETQVALRQAEESERRAREEAASLRREIARLRQTQER